MYKLPQLPYDQLQGFICELFNQMMVFSVTRDFEIDGKLIHSSVYNVSILTIPLSIEEPTKDAIENLKQQAEEELKKKSTDFLSSQNLTKRTLIIATNYALKLPFQDYLDSLKLDYPAIYLDWQDITLLADKSFPEQFSSVKQLPYDFKDAETELNYYLRGVDISSKIWGENSHETTLYRLRLANIYEKRELILEALNEHRKNIKIFKHPTISGRLYRGNFGILLTTFTQAGGLYFHLGNYTEGIKCFEEILQLAELIYDLESENILTILTGLLGGYLAISKFDVALNVFKKVERLPFENKGKVSTHGILTYSLMGLRIYHGIKNDEKAFEYFELLYTLLNKGENAILADDLLGLSQKWLQKNYPQYYEKTKSNNYLIENYSKSQFLAVEHKNVPYSLKQIQIRNYQCIKNISIESIPVDSQWIFITGKNGTGKSSLLQAIVMGLIGRNLPYDLKEDTIVEVELLQNSEDRIYRIGTEKLPILAYGASRLRIQSEQILEKNFELDNTYSLFRPTDGNLMNIEPWIKDAKLNGEEQKIEMVQGILEELMPSAKKIILKGSHITYIENGLETSLEKLASGNRSILAMVGDILIRLFHFFPDAKKPSDLQGIVLIDELDLHLHPYWQRELPWRLSEIFPNIQFICTTHSIIPFMGAPKRSVFFTMDRTEEEGSTIKRLDLDVSNFSADILLTSPLFSGSLFSKVAESEGNTQGYRTEDDYKEYEENLKQSKEFKELQEKYGDIFGDNLFKK